MKKTLFAFIVISFVFFAFQSLSAQVYKWVDEKGVTHFTDDASEVPERNRPKSEKINMPQTRDDTTTEEESASKESTPKDATSNKREQAYKDSLGRGEDYWRGQMEQWRTKLGDLQEKLEMLRTKYNELIEKFNASRNTAERGSIRVERDGVKAEMDQCRIEIDEAKTMLEKKIPDEADFYKAKREWVK